MYKGDEEPTFVYAPCFLLTTKAAVPLTFKYLRSGYLRKKSEKYNMVLLLNIVEIFKKVHNIVYRFYMNTILPFYMSTKDS